MGIKIKLYPAFAAPFFKIFEISFRILNFIRPKILEINPDFAIFEKNAMLTQANVYWGRVAQRFSREKNVQSIWVKAARRLRFFVDI